MLKAVGEILTLSGKYRTRLILSFAAGFLENAMTAASMLAIYFSLTWLLDGSLTGQKILSVSLALLALIPLRFLLKLMEYHLQSGTGYEIVCDARLSLGEKLRRLSMGFYSETDAGDISSVVNNDLVFVEGFAMAFLSKVVGGFASALMMAVFLFLMDWRIAVCSLIGYPVALLVNRRIQKHLTQYAPRRQAAHAGAASLMLEYLNGLFVIRAFGMAGRQEDRLKQTIKQLETISYDFEMKGLPWSILYLICFHACTAGTLMLVAHALLNLSIKLPTALLFSIMIFSFYAPMEQFGMLSGIVRLMSACLARMRSLMDYPLLDGDGTPITPAAHDVSFTNVSFAYGHKKVLRDISFHAPENTMTAIVGASGSGKSTMLNLIARFWDVTEGSVRIGGVDVRAMTCDHVIANISAVFQRAYLFHDTIYNNIRFGNPLADRDQVVDAAQKARCHDFIMALPDGYDTVVGEAGSTLSGGERQRVSIARALIKDTPIVLLDEVTANIDPENELLVHQAINELVQGKTVFIVAHKLTTIKGADRILVLNENGCIAESGTHDALLQLDGIYASLWEKSRNVSQWSLSRA